MNRHAMQSEDGYLLSGLLGKWEKGKEQREDKKRERQRQRERQKGEEIWGKTDTENKNK